MWKLNFGFKSNITWSVQDPNPIFYYASMEFNTKYICHRRWWKICKVHWKLFRVQPHIFSCFTYLNEMLRDFISWNDMKNISANCCVLFIFCCGKNGKNLMHYVFKKNGQTSFKQNLKIHKNFFFLYIIFNFHSLNVLILIVNRTIIFTCSIIFIK